MIIKIKRMDLKGWLYGLGAAVIGGGSAAVTAAVSATLLDPKDWGLTIDTLKLMGTCFGINALLNMFFYLKQSPMPAIVEEEKEVATNSR